MKRKKSNGFSALFQKFATKATRISGKPVTFIIAFLIIVLWLLTGPVFGYSDTWQLIINTGTTIITFLMVFIIQHTQNKDTYALQLKLNELIAATSTASNRLIDIEDLTTEDLETIKQFYIKLASLAKKEIDIHKTHSIDEAKQSHLKKALKK